MNIILKQEIRIICIHEAIFLKKMGLMEIGKEFIR